MRNNNKKLTIMLIAALATGYWLGAYINRPAYEPVLNKKHVTIKDFEYINWQEFDKNDARKILTHVLDAANIPHGDLAVPSQTVHSKRYLVSQWQRIAVGSTVMVLATDKNGELCVALGEQRGTLKHPQGYMETPLPKEDLTGFKAQNASRMNSNNGKLVVSDDSIEANAIRKVYEEIGLNIVKDQLHLLNITSDIVSSPTMIIANYFIKLPLTVALNTNYDEFLNDNLLKPMWVKLSDIKKNATGRYVTSASELPVDQMTIQLLNAALTKMKLKNV